MAYTKFPFKIEKQFRLPGYDYSQNGYYFVTICTHEKIDYFGKIINNQIQLSEIGKIVFNHWYEICTHFNNINLDEFIVMTNHIHGILIINNKNIVDINPEGRNMPWHVPTKINQFSKPIPKSLSMIINHFKGSVVKKCHQKQLKFKWQPRFHDHVIRNEKEYFAIKQYIRDNPKN